MSSSMSASEIAQPLFMIILMPVHPVQMIGLAIQEKSLVRVNRIKAQAQRLLDRSISAIVRPQLHDRPVKIWIFAPVPQMRLRQGEAQNNTAPCPRRERDGLFAARDCFSVRVQDAGHQLQLYSCSTCRWKFAP